jgi:hypothetical protein
MGQRRPTSLPSQGGSCRLIHSNRNVSRSFDYSDRVTRKPDLTPTPEFTLLLVFRIPGGGATSRPAFRWLDERGIVPQILAFLTDLCGTPERCSCIPSAPALH